MKPLWFESSDIDAPSLAYTSGTLVDVLKKCLVSGYNNKTIVNITVTSGTAVAQCVTHGFTAQTGKRVTVSGSTTSLLNGDKEILAVTTNSFAYAAPGVADGVYSAGTITVKRTTPNWTILFETADTIVLKAPSVLSNGWPLRVYDTTSNYARVRVYESMSDVNTGVDPTPTEGQVGGGLYWGKSSTADTTARNWCIVADDRGFYIFLNPYSVSIGSMVGHYFGDIEPFQSPDVYSTILTGATTTSLTTVQRGHIGYSFKTMATPSGVYAVRSSTGTTKSDQSRVVGASDIGTTDGVISGSTAYSSTSYDILPAGNTRLLGKVLLVGSLAYRGWLPGLFHHVGTKTNTTTREIYQIGADEYVLVGVGIPNAASIGTVSVSLSEWSR